MAETILLVLWVGTSLFFICREKKASDDRESHEWWLSEVKECMHSIECNFRRDCKKIIDNAFSKRNVIGGIIIGEYRKEITALEKEYKDNLNEKAIARKGKHSISSVPEYLEREYERNISEIADTFRYFGDFMSEQITRKEP